MRLAAPTCAALLVVWSSCGDGPAATTADTADTGDTTTTDTTTTDTTEPGTPDGSEPAVGVWLGTRELVGADNESLYGAVAMAGGDVVVVGAGATPGTGAEGSRWIVHRMSPSGAVRWSAGGHRGAALRGAAGPDDSVIVVGQYNVARYDADGSERWHALDDVWVTDVGIDFEGHVLVSGIYAGGPFIPDDTVRTPIGTTGGTYDGFVMRLDADDGHILDRVQIGTSGNDWVNGLAIGPEGGVYVTGPTEGTFPHATHVGSDGNSYVMRLASNLVLDWATQISDGYDQGYALRYDANTDQLAVLTGHGAGLTRVDAFTGDVLSSIYVADVAGTDLAIDAQSRVWFVGSTHAGPAFGMVTIIDPDDHVADPLWFADSPSQGISTASSLRGSTDTHSFGIALDAQGYAWIAGDTMGDLEQAKNTTTLAIGNSVDPGTDGTVARLTPDLARDRPRFVLGGVAPMTIGQSATLTLTLLDGSGESITLPPNSLAWSSALPEVASVSSAGVITALSGGRTRIQVALGPAHSEPLEVIVREPSRPERGSVVFIGADHADVATVVVADAFASEPGALLVGGWTDGPLAHSAEVPPELVDYDVMHGQRDAFIAEVASDGTVQHLVQLGGAVYDSIQQIIPLSDGSLLVRADLSAPHGLNSGHPLIARIDRDGRERWHFPGAWTADESFAIRSMSIMPNGHILVGGNNRSLLLAELDPDSGLELWRWIAEGHVQGGAGGVVMRQAGVRPDGTFVIVGDDEPAWRTWTLGLDPTQTEPIFGGPKVLFYGNASPQTGILPGAVAIAPAGVASGEFAAARGYGISTSQDGSGITRSRGASVVYFNADGSLKWNTSPELDDFAGEQSIGAIVIDADGFTYVAGTRGRPDADTLAEQVDQFDAFIAKLDRAGTTLWFQMVAGPGNDFGESVALTANGELALVGYSYGSIDGTALHGAPGKESCDAFLVRFGLDGARR